MERKTPLKDLARNFRAKWLNKNHIVFSGPGYEVDVIHRTRHNLVVTFGPMMDPGEPPAQLGWGYKFLEKKNVSAIHVRTTKNCWYRGEWLERFFSSASEMGLFDRFGKVMTYGGSMGGFGAMSYAKLCKADICLAMNPQAMLGPSVRSWETRYKSADIQNWDHPLCNVSEQLSSVNYAVVVYDPYYDLDRKQVDLIKKYDLIHLHIPFVGHNIPVHLQFMGVLGQLFDDSLAQAIDPNKYYSLFRSRRRLQRYKNELLSRVKGRERFYCIINQYLSDDLIGMA